MNAPAAPPRWLALVEADPAHVQDTPYLQLRRQHGWTGQEAALAKGAAEALLRQRAAPSAPATPARRPTGRTHLVIGDAHAQPGEDLSRFYLAGCLIRDLRPDVVICLGDFADMASLSSYDRGKKAAEGERYVADIAAANEALALLHEPIDLHNAAHPGERVAPRFVYLEGNHEERIERAASDWPALDGAIGLHDLEFAARGWEVHRFLRVVEIDGISYSHYFQNRNSRFPIGGVSPGRAMLQKLHRSCVAGHSHVYDHHEESTLDGGRIHGLVAGCFFEKWKSYAGQSNGKWWSGLVLLRLLAGAGDYDVERWSMARIRAAWMAEWTARQVAAAAAGRR